MPRALWRCRRGLKELDLLLEGFARAVLPHAPPAEHALFERLLELPDPLLAGYFLGAGQPDDPALAGLVQRIGAYVSSSARGRMLRGDGP